MSAADPAVSREYLLVLVGSLRQQNSALEDQNAVLTSRVEQQDGETAQFRAQVAELEQRLCRSWGNSDLKFPPDLGQRVLTLRG